MDFAVAVVPERSEPGFVVACRGRTLGLVPLCADVYGLPSKLLYVMRCSIHFGAFYVRPHFCKPGVYLHHRVERKK